MKQYIIMKKSTSEIVKDQVTTKIYTDENISEALEVCRRHNILKDKLFRYELVELTSLVQVKAECNMSEDEIKEHRETISKMNDELNEIIDYDEWAGREYGETRVDYYSSAVRLYNAGYRKITKIEE